MSYDEKNRKRLELRLHEHEKAEEPNDIVFDFEGLQRPAAAELAMILTARLASDDPEDRYWVRSVSWETARILEVLHLDHLFRRYPDAEGEPN